MGKFSSNSVRFILPDALSKGKNQNKSNKHPKKYFADISDAEMKKAFIDRDLLDYRFYRKNLKQRGEKILAYVKKKVGFKEGDTVQDLLDKELDCLII